MEGDWNQITQDKEYLKEKMKSLTSMGLNQLLPGDTGEAKHVPASDFCFVSAGKKSMQSSHSQMIVPYFGSYLVIFLCCID